VQHLQEVNDQLQEEVVASQAGLMEVQQQVTDARVSAADAEAAAADAAAQAAAAEKSRAALKEQLEELNAKVGFGVVKRVRVGGLGPSKGALLQHACIEA
jgi:chromosome segregation ATPase